MTRPLTGISDPDALTVTHGAVADVRRERAEVHYSDSNTMRGWENFLAGESTTAIPVALIASWKRSVQAGVSPAAVAAPFVVHGNALAALHWRHRDLISASDLLFAATADLLIESHSILLLTNAQGVVLRAAGGLRTLDAGEKIHLAEGADWRESTAGTNGIGTALATEEPTYIHGSAHFCEGIKGWSCAAAPICEPGTSKVIGVVDISGPPSTYQINNLTLAVAAAQQIQMVLAEQLARSHTQLLSFCLGHLSSADLGGLIAIDRRGRLVHTTTRVPLSVSVGECFVGMSEDKAVVEWATQLPQGLKPEWFNPVVVDGETIGAMLIVPSRATWDGATRRVTPPAAHANTEIDLQRNGFDQILGHSAAMHAALDRGRQLARRRVPVLVEGETGVGKELFARAIHGEEGSKGSFIAYNCGAASKEMIASDLFGHVRGAYTGATSEGRPGRFEQAHGGTLCLDEIGELPLELQPVLLRALEEGVIYRLGDTRPTKVDVRLVAMTNRNLREEVECGRFRPDLYYRVSVTRIRIPPLRERDIDIDMLLNHFNQKIARRHAMQARRFPEAVMAVLRGYAWPGNVRELRNVIENLLLTSNSETVGLAELPYEVLNEMDASTKLPALPLADLQATRLEQTEQAAIGRAVQSAHGNLAQAARALGVSRSTLYRKLESYRG